MTAWPARVLQPSTYGPNFMTLCEAANYLRVTHATVCRHIRDGMFADYVFDGTPRLVNVIDLLRWERRLSPVVEDGLSQWAPPV